MAWNAAVGWAVWAHDYANGVIVHAAEANSTVAAQYLRQNWFFTWAKFIADHGLWMTFVIPLLLQARRAARARRQREQGMA